MGLGYHFLDRQLQGSNNQQRGCFHHLQRLELWHSLLLQSRLLYSRQLRINQAPLELKEAHPPSSAILLLQLNLLAQQVASLPYLEVPLLQTRLLASLGVLELHLLSLPPYLESQLHNQRQLLLGRVRELQVASLIQLLLAKVE